MADVLTQEQRNKAKEVFDAYDADKSNTVEKTELKKMLRELQVFENASLADIYTDMVFKQNDKDQSGKLDFEEFLAIYKKLVQPKVERKVFTLG